MGVNFNEHEMTVAVAAVARQSFAALPSVLRRRSGAATWDELSKGARYDYLRGAGDVVLPALAALPEKDTVGVKIEFSDAEYEEAALAVMPDARELSDRKRRKALAAITQVVRIAVEAIPARADPDTLIVPDHL